jgi:hypothetical protein
MALFSSLLAGALQAFAPASGKRALFRSFLALFGVDSRGAIP